MNASKPWLTSTELVLSLGLASPLSTSPDPAWPSLIPKPKPYPPAPPLRALELIIPPRLIRLAE
jgi:hypothetical protein